MTKNESKLLSLRGIAKVSAFCLLFSAFSVNATMATSAPAGSALDTQVTQQGKVVTGTVVDEAGIPVIGANVIQKGTTNGVITDLDGNFSLEVPDGAVIEISYIGYTSQEITASGQTGLQVKLAEDTQKIDEVVVTALGIKRQSRSLGYSTTQVGGEDFTMARDPNLGNALSGKVAGVNVSGNATGTGGSSRVVIRGNASMTGNNMPLYVIDGVPFSNEISFSSGAGQWGGKDMGDGLSNINPDDIESIQVLKGAAASALYGYRGGNGAILITTKSGKKGKPISIEFNNNLTFNKIYDYRDFQQVYGQGTMGNRPMSVDAARSTEQSSWGDRLGGTHINFLGNEEPYEYINNWPNFYRTGINNTTSASISGAGDKITYRFGVSNMTDKSILPNASVSQQGINLNTTYDILKNLHLTVNANYVFEKNKGKASLSDGNGNTNASLLYRPANFDIRWMERGGADCDWGTNPDGTEMIGGTNVYFNNPYWLQYRKTNETNKNRLTGAITLKYDIFDWLYIQGAVQRDGYNLKYKEIQPKGAAADAVGFLTEYSQAFSEINLNYLIGFNKEFGDWSIGATLGGNRQRTISERWMVDGGRPFLADGLYSPNNLGDKRFIKNYQEYQVNSVYATADFGWKNQIFLNLTGRNDWFSTLNPDNNSYFYPSATLSWVFTDSFRDSMPDWFDFGKIRGSYAMSSNGTDPYQNYLTYKVRNYQVNGQYVATVNNSTYPNFELKPVEISEWEVGLNLAFLSNRLSFDMAYYTKNTKDDIAVVSTSNTSGWGSRIQNVGEIQNRGFEFMVNAVPVHTNEFDWNTTLNFAINDSEVKYLGGPESLIMDNGTSNVGNVTVQNIVGSSFGELVGYKYKRHNGQIVYENGIPQREDKLSSIGNGVYKLTGGWHNQFSYKNFSLSFLIDFKFGADIFSGTNYQLVSSGMHKKTLKGRENDPVGKIVGEGVMLDSSGNYVPNTVGVSAQEYWQGITTSQIAEEFIYDASFIKLRELSFGYNFPQSLLNKMKVVKGLNVSLVARNLWTIMKHTDNIDPESAYNNSNAQGLELNGYPATRSIGFNVNVKF